MFRPLSVFNRNRNTLPARNEGVGDPFFQLHREMNRLFDDFFTDFGAPSLLSDAGGGRARPVHMEYKDTDRALEIDAELPGVEEDDIDVQLQDNLLTIKAEKRFEEEEEGRSTRSYSSFSRSVALPYDVDGDRVEATFKNGVLKLTLPKPPEIAAKTKKIAVQRG